jgi:hypothetical protein
VKKDFITQCDWLCWHRLTWDNDTKVVSRILGSDYGDAVEDLDDGEGFLMTDWAESIRRVQFHRKQTFDAGATPGLDDFERPDLKSVSGDLVSELKTITDERERTESELADLRQELDKKKQRIAQLERELEEAQDMSDMADTFAQALLQKAEAPYRGGSGRTLRRDAAGAAPAPPANGSAPEPQRRDEDAAFGRPPTDDQAALHDYEDPDDAAASASSAGSGSAEAGDGREGDATGGADGSEAAGGGVSAAAASAADNGTAATTGSPAASADAADSSGSASDERVASAVPPTDGVDISPARSRSGFDEVEDAAAFLEGDELRHRQAVVAGFVRAVESLEDVTRGMLGAYRWADRATPVEAHRAADGSGDRRYAYARNKVLRRAGFVEHRSRGEYAYALPELVRRVYGEHTDEQDLVEMIAEIEARAGLDPDVAP